MWLLYILYALAVIAFIIIAIMATKSVIKRKKIQQQTKYNFVSHQGNYTFNYSIKSFNLEGVIKTKIIHSAIIGMSDIAYYETNKFIGMKVFIDNKEISDVSTKVVGGYSVNAEVIIPGEYVQENTINANLEIRVNWYFSNKNIEDILSFNYEETL